VRYVELFAGGGGLSHGLDHAGWSCVAHAEIEPHARAVLRAHWPDTPLFGDVSTIDGRQWRGQVDVISGGSPCQDMSVAGKRAGLGGARSSLFHQQVRIWHESDAPYLLWENVAGAFSSNNGKDFAAVLSALVGAAIAVPSDGWERGGVAAGRDAVAAWRVLDLQHFGPPQRRVRVFIVAARTGAHDPAEILALGEGVCGHPSPREQAREGVTAGARGGVEGGSVARTTFAVDDESNGRDELMGTLPASCGIRSVVATLVDGGRSHGAGDSYDNTPVIIATPLQEVGKRTGVSTDDVRCGLGIGEPDAPMYTLQAGAQHGVVAIALRGREEGGRPELSTEVPALRTPGGGSSHPLVMALDGADVVGSLLRRGDSSPCVDRGQPAVIAFDNRPQIASDGIDDTVTTEGARNPTAVIVGNSGMESWRTTDTAITLAARDAKGTNNVVVGTLDFGAHGGSYNGQDAYQNRIRAEHGRPRRITPRECERLMGWPDDWTRYGVKEDGTRYELSDTARYRICGNGVGSPCAEWIARRFAA